MSSKKFNNSSELAVVKIEDCVAGTFVRKVNICDTCHGVGAHDKGPCDDCDRLGYRAHDKTYARDAYDRVMKKYALTDVNDFCREVYTKAGTKVLVGFTY